MTTMMMMLFWDLHTAAAADDDDGGGGDGDDDGDDNDNDDNYDDDLLVAPDRPSTAKTLTDDCSALYWTQELGLTCLESVERAIMLLTALKPGRMGAERARLRNKEQRRPFYLTQIQSDQRSDFLRNTHHQLNGKILRAIYAGPVL